MAELKRQLTTYIELMRLDKPIGTLLLLWPTWWALWFIRTPSLEMGMIFSFGVVIMRSAGCVVNDYADRHFDGQVTRTKNRPFPTGRASKRGARIVFLLLLFCAFLLVLQLNWMSVAVAFVAVFLATLYPFMKRYTHFPQFILGLAYSMPIPMVYAATTNSLPLICGFLFAANVCWNMAYDTEYALVDREDDVRAGIKSTAVFFGDYTTTFIGVLQAIMLSCLMIIGFLSRSGALYYVALLIALFFFIGQHRYLKQRCPDAYFKAFLNNNYVGMVIWFGIIANLYWDTSPYSL